LIAASGNHSYIRPDLGVNPTGDHRVAACAFCGRENEEGARFCIDCGKSIAPSIAKIMSPLAVQSAAASLEARRASSGPPPASPPGSPSGTPAPGAAGPAAPAKGRRTVACPKCGGAYDPALPFCAHCGARTGAQVAPGAAPATDPGAGSGAQLALLDTTGSVKQSFALTRGEAIVGRSDGDIQFEDDVYLSPVHAQFALRDGQLWVRDLGSRNGTWVFLDVPHRLADGDVVLVGSQLLRFRRLGYPGPHPPEADRTRRLGSLTPTADIAVLAQLRADGSVRDTFHLSPGRNVLIGRDKGDWLFPYDQTMSGTHAEVRSEDSDFVVADAGSRNGVAVAVRGERALKLHQRVLLGDRVLRVERL
jgi:pSer/pThr/pTyr-binding forkhead associated (FHA) protein